jgi:hypothetical protein
MNIFLQHVSHTFSEHFLVLQVDQARWHRSKDRVVPENICLLAQPPLLLNETLLSICGMIVEKNMFILVVLDR